VTRLHNSKALRRRQPSHGVLGALPKASGGVTTAPLPSPCFLQRPFVRGDVEEHCDVSARNTSLDPGVVSRWSVSGRKTDDRGVRRSLPPWVSD
jgi:hypothetical protein